MKPTTTGVIVSRTYAKAASSFDVLCNLLKPTSPSTVRRLQLKHQSKGKKYFLF